MNISQAIQLIIDEHKQVHQNSCIASAIEIVLKALRKVDVDFYDVQNEWPNEDGKLTFADFRDKLIHGIHFKHEFNIPRNPSFPFEKLFQTIDSELIANRYVMISLPSQMIPVPLRSGSHICIIYGEKDCDFLALTKAGKDTIRLNNLKNKIQKAGGTDILVYRY